MVMNMGPYRNPLSLMSFCKSGCFFPRFRFTSVFGEKKEAGTLDLSLEPDL